MAMRDAEDSRTSALAAARGLSVLVALAGVFFTVPRECDLRAQTRQLSTAAVKLTS